MKSAWKMINSSSRYHSLPQDEPEKELAHGVDSPEFEEQPPELKRDHPQVPLLNHIAIALIIISITLDVYLVLYTMGYRFGSNWDKAVDIKTLEAPTTYIGFDEIYHNKSAPTQYPPIYNRARYFFQVSATEKNKQFPLWTDREISIEGFVQTAANRLRVTEEISTVAQFRVLDYGMENCTLYLDIPKRNGTFSSVRINKEGGDMPIIDIWALSSTNNRISREAMTWSRKPERKSHLASISLGYGTKGALATFHCPAGTYHAFEIACAASQPCDIDTKNSEWYNDALYIMQSQTI